MIHEDISCPAKLSYWKFREQYAKDYDEKHYQLPDLDALEVIKYKMQEMGVKSKDLEPLIGSKGHVSAVLSGKREITLKMAQKLKNYFSIPAEVFLHNA